ncbi:MAG: hypothetical protein U0736_08490 [Gemmataceae bacterium]
MHDSIYFVLLISALCTAGLTAFYTFRATSRRSGASWWCRTRRITITATATAMTRMGTTTAGTRPAQQATHAHAGGHGHDEVRSFESPAVMTVPLMVLAVFAVGIGFVLGPFMPEAAPVRALHGEDGAHVVLGARRRRASRQLDADGPQLGDRPGQDRAWLMYVKRPELPGKVAEAARRAQLSLNKFFIDEIYGMLIVRPAGDRRSVEAVRRRADRQLCRPGRSSAAACSARCSDRSRTGWCSLCAWR